MGTSWEASAILGRTPYRATDEHSPHRDDREPPRPRLRVGGALRGGLKARRKKKEEEGEYASYHQGGESRKARKGQNALEGDGEQWLFYQSVGATTDSAWEEGTQAAPLCDGVEVVRFCTKDILSWSEFTAVCSVDAEAIGRWTRRECTRS